ncbi:AvrD family protein [Verminephrobacter eiseniae]|uniref:AvrD family protein n=1 Tax=Verminephrobacter eiseniae TaxID=364317 RepID=UPI00223905C9|nr:AvrD family protein [Verminephrobacter eiseniae]MCW5235657.1 hypothetical protein [Verminephrobacter eiseniae]
MISLFKEIEEVLGSSHERYFGSKYLQTKQIFRKSSCTKISDREVEFSGTGSVVFPSIWSVKNSKIQEPHLSSIDAIEFAMQVVPEIHAEFGGVRDISYGQIIRLEIVAGTNPLKEGLVGFMISGRALLDQNLGEIEIAMSIGNMRSKIKTRLASQTVTIVVPPESQIVAIKDLRMDEEEKWITAVLHPSDTSAPGKWSLTSCFANALQLGQVLLYQIDGIDRGSSNTLWMRKLVITVNEEVAVQNGLQPARVALKNFKLLERGLDRWRCADIDAVLCGVNIVCSVAHILPDSYAKPGLGFPTS